MSNSSGKSHSLSAGEFNRKFIILIMLAWIVPAVFGLSFILFINILSVEQMLGILLTPTEPAFIILWLFFAVYYFKNYITPVTELMESSREQEKEQAALRCMQGFAIRFWLLFLCYLFFK